MPESSIISKSGTEPLVVYHANCYDGFTAAWAAWLELGDEAKYLSMDYDDIPGPLRDDEGLWDSCDEVKEWREEFEEMIKGRDVYVLDFSFDSVLGKGFNKAADKFLVLDHHESARRDCEGFDFCRFDMDKSGARLAWEHFHPDEDAPDIVRYVEDRDLWNWTLSHSRAVNAGIRSYEFDFQRWTKWLEDEEIFFPSPKEGPMAGILGQEGAGILRQQEKTVERLAEQASTVWLPVGDMFEDSDWKTPLEFEMPCVNSPVPQSELGNKLAEESEIGAALIWHVQKDGQVKCSLRAVDRGPDVSEIAEYHGGGGHENAARFVGVSRSLLEELM